jgi:hypothetical protein
MLQQAEKVLGVVFHGITIDGCFRLTGGPPVIDYELEAPG